MQRGQSYEVCLSLF